MASYPSSRSIMHFVRLKDTPYSSSSHSMTPKQTNDAQKDHRVDDNDNDNDNDGHSDRPSVRLPFCRYKGPGPSDTTPPVAPSITPCVHSTPSTPSTPWSSSRIIDVYTDGSCTNNGKRNAIGGIGVFFGDGDRNNISRHVPASADLNITNQTMELLACCEAIEVFYGQTVTSGGPAAAPAASASAVPSFMLRICSDSEYTVKSMNCWVRSWEMADWKTSAHRPVANLGLIRRLHGLRNAHNVHFVHVPAHRKCPDGRASEQERRHWYGNMRADELARASIAAFGTSTVPGTSVRRRRGAGGSNGRGSERNVQSVKTMQSARRRRA